MLQGRTGSATRRPLANETEYPAWCVEVVRGDSLQPGPATTIIHKWKFFIGQVRCLYSADTQKIASFDLWTDNADRHMGNVMRGADGSYVAIDHESLLTSPVWKPTGKYYKANRLVDSAAALLPKKKKNQFYGGIALAAGTHAQALANVSTDVQVLADDLGVELNMNNLANVILNFLNARSLPAWMPATISTLP